MSVNKTWPISNFRSETCSASINIGLFSTIAFLLSTASRSSLVAFTRIELSALLRLPIRLYQGRHRQGERNVDTKKPHGLLDRAAFIGDLPGGLGSIYNDVINHT